MTTSISSNLIANTTGATIGKTSSAIAKAAKQLSTGERITKASDDAAGLSVGTGLKINMTALKTALTATGQANAVLGVADGAATGILDGLTRMKELTMQAAMGSSSSNERGYYNEEFQQLVSEQDRLVVTSTFNNKALLDGSLSGGKGVESNTASASEGATASANITFTGTVGTANAVAALNINGVAFDFDFTGAATVVTGANIVIDGTLTTTKASTIANIINNVGTDYHSTMTEQNAARLSDLVATANGNTLTITSKKEGVAGSFLVTAGGVANSAEYMATTSAGSTSYTVINGTAGTVSGYYSAGSTTGSLGRSSVSVQGTVGDNILKTLTQTTATSGWVTVNATDLANEDVLSVFGTKLTLKNKVETPESQILRSTSSDLETLKNIATYLNNSEDSNIANYIYEARLDSGNLQIRATAKGATSTVNGANLIIDTTTVSVSAGTAGAADGIDVSHISDNASFMGKLSGFTATRTGDDAVKLSIKAGDYTYEAEVKDTAPTADYIIRMKSNDLDGKGGWFDLQLAANNGVTVANQAEADNFAKRINDAVATLNFYQNRDISTFDASGTSIEDTVISMTSKSFDAINVADIKVVGSTETNDQKAQLSITLSDGRTFSKTDLAESAPKGQKIELINTTDSNEKISIIWGKDVKFITDTEVSTLNNDLLSAFKANQAGMSFQVGTKTDQVIDVELGDLSTKAVFKGEVLDITTEEGAKKAGEVIDAAIDEVKGARASIGAQQARFDSAASNIATTLQNTDAARAVYLDTNVAESSTNFGLAQVKMNASISVLAQVNNLPQSLLKLLG
ncbi:flagellin N-terminal helical domain-containing protein [Candidatus Jidaibacter acanthamoebae]|nr:flagellin [Candidatus Jidaibacter acanthamoeba]